MGVYGYRLLFSIVSVSRPFSALQMILLRHPDLTIPSTTLTRGGSNMHGYFHFTHGYCKPRQFYAIYSLATKQYCDTQAANSSGRVIGSRKPHAAATNTCIQPQIRYERRPGYVSSQSVVLV